ncbi:hypothetical protein FLA105534_01518 [Flavobacterium bizetiae]|uniref:Phage abortive infection protein n=1 Tax=Flavobacterium bizetiae TaxID=2704140 RepID=A0A6J4GFY0_9FLAO|nr:hypothetical protein [Flavobacterium bizetiae]CAA9197206.1 hypothetical protein FLA105534_01518 [Flavobacterium bizetiae]CAD5342622.1 hypothetical protein FLA105535_02610 [Flavobacterium bizetiae]CAD5348157.1 hypothetical protein FLA105534_02116 [Flavobacterium bizetiae]
MSKSFFEKNKTFVFVSAFSISLVLAPIIVFLYHFWNHTISNDMAVWGTFGDYMGGTINTILTLSSLIILAYLTKLVSDQSLEDNKDLNLLVRRLDCYDRVTLYLPELHLKVVDLANLDVNTNTEQLRLENKKEVELSARFFYEIHIFLQTFPIRYRHVFKYDFNKNEYKVLIEKAKSMQDLVMVGVAQTVTGEIDPDIPTDDFTNFLDLYLAFINELSLELK